MVLRISNPILTNTALRNLQTSLRRLQNTQEVLATGLRIRRPSDDPLDTATVLRLKADIVEINRFIVNIDRAESFVTATDGALGTMNDTLLELREIAVIGANDVENAESRAAAAVEVNALIEQFVQAANSDFAGRYIFAGYETETIPFVRLDYGVEYRGDNGLIYEEIGPGNLIPINIPGNVAFSTATGEVIGNVDLNPDIGLSLDNSLANLNNGTGVQSGHIVITDGSGASATIDLTEAATIGDVVIAINTAEEIDVVASIKPEGNGLLITDTSGGVGPLQITELGGTTAADLGILGSAVGFISGSDILNFDMPLAHLNGGRGVLPGSIVITDGSGASATVNLAAAVTIGDVIAAINAAAGIDVTASINTDGNGLLITDNTGGPNPLQIAESGGTTAADLGIFGSSMGFIIGTDLDPIIEGSAVTPTTLLADVNFGNGVDMVTASFNIMDRDSNTATINITGATSVGDVVTAINGAGINVTAAIAADGSGIDLTDTVSTGRSQITVTEAGGTTAADLGLLGTGVGSTLYGARLDPAGVPSTSLALLNGGRGISLGTIRITNGTLSASTDLSGAVTVGNVLAAIERAGVRVDATVDSGGERLIITSQTGDTPIIIVSDGAADTTEDLGLFAPSLFDTAEEVRQALLNNDPERLTQLIGDIDDVIEQITAARANAGEQMVQTGHARSRLLDLELNLDTLRSKTEEADLTEFAIRLVNQETIYQAALETTIRVIQPTIFSFLR